MKYSLILLWTVSLSLILPNLGCKKGGYNQKRFAQKPGLEAVLDPGTEGGNNPAGDETGNAGEEDVGPLSEEEQKMLAEQDGIYAEETNVVLDASVKQSINDSVEELIKSQLSDTPKDIVMKELMSQDPEYLSEVIRRLIKERNPEELVNLPTSAILEVVAEKAKEYGVEEEEPEAENDEINNKELTQDMSLEQIMAIQEILCEGENMVLKGIIGGRPICYEIKTGGNTIVSSQKEVIIKEVPVIQEVVKEVPVEKLVVKEVVKEVPVEKVVIKEVPIEVIKEVIKEVPKEVTKTVTVQKCSFNSAVMAMNFKLRKSTIRVGGRVIKDYVPKKRRWFDAAGTFVLPGDATEISAKIHTLHIDDNSPTLFLNGAKVLDWSKDNKGRRARKKTGLNIDISKHLKAGNNKVYGYAYDRYGVVYTMLPVVSGSYKTKQKCMH